jgi:hypothetical protein
VKIMGNCQDYRKGRENYNCMGQNVGHYDDQGLDLHLWSIGNLGFLTVSLGVLEHGTVSLGHSG